VVTLAAENYSRENGERGRYRRGFVERGDRETESGEPPPWFGASALLQMGVLYSRRLMRHAFRQLMMNPGFTIVALVTLALGIGVNTTAFTVLNRLMLQSLPFRDPGTLVQVWSHTTRDGNVLVPPADYFDLKTQNAVFTDMAAYSPWNTTSYAEAGKAPIQVGAIYMTANFFPILGVQPQLGRTPTEEESKKSQLHNPRIPQQTRLTIKHATRNA